MTCHAITMSVPLVDLWSYLALLVLISVSFLWLPLCTMFILEKTITPVSIPGPPTIYQQVMGLFTPLRASRTRTSTTNILSLLYPFENEFITGLCPVDYMGARYLLPSWASMVSWTDLIGCSSMVWLVNWTVGAAYTSCVRCASALGAFHIGVTSLMSYVTSTIFIVLEKIFNIFPRTSFSEYVRHIVHATSRRTLMSTVYTFINKVLDTWNVDPFIRSTRKCFFNIINVFIKIVFPTIVPAVTMATCEYVHFMFTDRWEYTFLSLDFFQWTKLTSVFLCLPEVYKLMKKCYYDTFNLTDIKYALPLVVSCLSYTCVSFADSWMSLLEVFLFDNVFRHIQSSHFIFFLCRMSLNSQICIPLGGT